MELIRISMFEAKENDIPAYYTKEGDNIEWYALDDDGEYKGFMEITEADSISEITLLYVPDLYQDNGYASFMLSEYIAKFWPRENMLTAVYENDGYNGSKYEKIFSKHGFNIEHDEYKEYIIPFEDAFKKFSNDRHYSYNGRMFNLAHGIDEVLKRFEDIMNNDVGITLRSIHTSDLERSIAAISEEDKLEALLLVERDFEREEAVVKYLYTSTDDLMTLRAFFAFAVENAKYSMIPPKVISFAAINEKLEKMIDSLFDNPMTSTLVMADAQFSEVKYITQLRINKMMAGGK